MTSTKKRLIFATLVSSTILALLSLMVISLFSGDVTMQGLVLLVCFTMTLPWTAIGFWNAVIGFLLMRFSKNPAAHVYPAVGEVDDNDDITASTAITMCIRNEDVDQVNRNLTAMMARLVASGHSRKFHIYVLSDSSFDNVITKEEFTFEKLRRDWSGKIDITYRRRTDNWGFKAGNIKEFCNQFGANHDYMLTLDADSVMSASSILRLVRIMQKNDNLGILQSLVVGLPSDSAFTRVFQFGMRMGMKSFTLGSAWWQGDCGPYWGHNALIRLKPFMEHCNLPVLEGSGALSGYILSHDQVEAAYMRRAGYECRVVAEECGSYEENPPHILEFIRRDLRWCHGNMQYFRLLGEKGLLPTSRVQLVLAILMFVGAPAWLTFVLFATGGLVFSDHMFKGFAPGPGLVLFLTIMFMIFTPKILSITDVMMRSELRKAYGGGFFVIASAVVELIFSMLLAPIMAIAETVFLAGLPFGKARGWASQNRQAKSLQVRTLATHLYAQTAFGLIGFIGLLSMEMVNFAGFLICLPVFIGPAFAVPFGYSSAHLKIGQFFARIGLWQLPEEGRPPVILRALNLPALAERARVVADKESRKPLTTAELLAIEGELDDRLVA